ncbi:PREDICTED: cytochrome c oxidase subunit 7B2, mitochondrial-like [Chrysochloris asiatica]|uniref:Cytochrome c oxidase subunit 7B2, mitochondrial-like n=1 Tax=Chrysochloris asiatica TaxID=185453 RepID=A0A9B0WZ96_CHRAS|nr:PREDICTED: cytochrome c oxidase subunit 7B2, mitochondrial-like [Chrysochloris asiatica]
MFPLARNALRRLKIQSIQHMVARHCHQKHSPDFHDKYGNAILASGVAFCFCSGIYLVTQTGIQWNLSPVGRVIPKEWREK